MIERFALVDDPHERMAALVAFRPNLEPLVSRERCEEALVRGCVSRVWLVGTLEQGRCRFRFDAESPMVKGLAGVLCALYDNAEPREVVEVEPEIFSQLGIDRHLTPTRLNGLAQLRRVIREFAQSCMEQ